MEIVAAELCVLCSEASTDRVSSISFLDSIPSHNLSQQLFCPVTEVAPSMFKAKVLYDSGLITHDRLAQYSARIYF